MIPELHFWKLMRKPVGIFLLCILGVVLVFAAVHLGLDLAFHNDIAKGVKVGGVDVGGMTKDAALQKLKDNLDFPQLESDIVASFGGASWNLPLSRIDGYVDLQAMVDEAYAADWSVPFWERWGRRTLFLGADKDIGVVYSYNEAKFTAWMGELETLVNREPANAEVKLNSGKLVFQHAADGWKLNATEATQAVLSAFAAPDHTAVLPVAVTPPQIFDNQTGKVIVVNTGAHVLTLYNNMQVEVEYGIACGMPEWPTPKGTFSIVSKQKNPTWVNPGSSWATTMPPYIGPGPGNPLGTRALQTSASGVFIHGTYSDWSIGYSVSHGCIRMHIPESEDLFERVEVGTPVLIWTG